jgi:hypothetical protein
MQIKHYNHHTSKVTKPFDTSSIILDLVCRNIEY